MSASAPDPSARALALELLLEEGAELNRLVPARLATSRLDQRDRAFVTALVHGATRMRRACDFLVDRFLLRPPDRRTRATLRLGAYQLHFLATPPHAAVSATVAVAPPRTRGLVNAVLRRVAEAPVEWPDVATRLSYPDWVVERLVADLGEPDALAALEQMDEAPTPHVRPDGYVQDLASQWVAADVAARPGERVADLCAAPGGKATALAAAGAVVVAADLDPARSALLAANAAATGTGTGTGGEVQVVVADGRRPPLRAGAFDRVLVDAPCSGLGVLRRRPDARWRRHPDDVARLAALQRQLLVAAAPLVRPGGRLVYSVCTLTRAETTGVDQAGAPDLSGFAPLPPPGPPWRPSGRGALLLPQAAGTDGMFVIHYERTT